MKTSFLPLIKRCLKIYFSNVSHKDYEYKRAIFDSLSNMGGIYIKFLQTLCVTNKFMEGWSGPKEFEIFNKVKTEKINLSKIVKKENFKSLDEIPFASGSFAQIYKGTLLNDEQVVLKVLRPSVYKNLKFELKKLNRLVNILNRFLPNSLINYKEVFKEFSKNALKGTNYSREVSNIKYFRNLYKDNSKIIIPKVYEELCNKFIIVEEFIEGPTLSDVISNLKPEQSLDEAVYNINGSDVWKQIILAGGEALRTAMCEDFVFGDPHPGNIILLPENKIAYIDFGIVAPKPNSQEAYYLWVKSYYNILNGNPDYGKLLEYSCLCFCPDLVNALKKCATNNDLFTSISKAINQKALVLSKNNKNFDETVKQGHLLVAFTNFIDNANSLNLKIDMKNFQLLKAMQAFICSVTTIDKKYGNKKYNDIILKSMEYALSYCDKVGINHDMILKSKYTVNESYELLIDMLSSIANGDEFLFNSICEEMF